MKHVASRGVGIGCAESLTAFIRRASGAWSAEQTAIANGVEVNSPLESDWAVKVPVREAHGDWSTRAPPGVRRNCPTCGGGAPVIAGLACRPSVAWMGRRRESAQLAPVSSVSSPESVDDTRCELRPANGMAIAHPHGGAPARHRPSWSPCAFEWHRAESHARAVRNPEAAGRRDADLAASNRPFCVSRGSARYPFLASGIG